MNRLQEPSLLAIDGAFLTSVARQFGLPHISPATVRAACEEDGFDILETFTTLIQEVPETLDDRLVGEKQNSFEKRRRALEAAGATVVPCPSRRMDSGFKQSDDQRLVVKALSFCLRVRPRFLCLAAGDRDYIPLVEELRSLGIRTLLLTYREFCSYDLERICWKTYILGDHLDLEAERNSLRFSYDAQQDAAPGDLAPPRDQD